MDRPKAALFNRVMVISGLLLVVSLAAAIVLTIRARNAAAASARFRAARVCGLSAVSGCIREVPVVVADIYTSPSAYHDPSHLYVTVRLPGGQTVGMEESSGVDVFRVLTSGMRVRAEYWQGKLVALRASNGRVLTTTAAPQSELTNSLWWIVICLVGAMIAGWLLVIAFYQRKVRV